jgi:hypothetical protein
MQQPYFGREPCPAVLTFEGDFAVVEHLEFGPVRNADDGCCAELLGQKFHQMILALEEITAQTDMFRKLKELFGV